MNKSTDKSLKAVALLCLLASCGGANSSGTAEEPNFGTTPTTIDRSALGTAINLNYNFTIQIDDDDNTLDLTVPFPDTYEAPFYFNTDGTVSLIANEFPQMIFRVCDGESTTTACDAYYDGLGNDFDLVIDSCGATLEDEDCGTADTTVFSGTLASTGDMAVNATSIRVRLFSSTSSPNGFTANDTDSGLLNLEHMVAKITTAALTSGDRSPVGSRLNSSAITLVAAGSVPDDLPVIGGAHYAATISGTFESDPLELLE